VSCENSNDSYDVYKERHARPWETRTVISLETLMMRRSFHMRTYRSATLKGKRNPRPGTVAGHAKGVAKPKGVAKHTAPDLGTT